MQQIRCFFNNLIAVPTPVNRFKHGFHRQRAYSGTEVRVWISETFIGKNSLPVDQKKSRIRLADFARSKTAFAKNPGIPYRQPDNSLQCISNAESLCLTINPGIDTVILFLKHFRFPETGAKIPRTLTAAAGTAAAGIFPSHIRFNLLQRSISTGFIRLDAVVNTPCPFSDRTERSSRQPLTDKMKKYRRT